MANAVESLFLILMRLKNLISLLNTKRIKLINNLIRNQRISLISNFRIGILGTKHTSSRRNTYAFKRTINLLLQSFLNLFNGCRNPGYIMNLSIKHGPCCMLPNLLSHNVESLAFHITHAAYYTSCTNIKSKNHIVR